MTHPATSPTKGETREMKDAAYTCPKEVADAVEAAREALTKAYGKGGFTLLVTAPNGKLLAAASRPLAGGDVKARAS